MDFSRIQHVVDIERTQNSQVTVFGAGASFTLLGNLARCGVGSFILADPDTIEASNVARQGHTTDQLGVYKVDAVSNHLRRINPDIRMTTFPRDCTTMTDEEIEQNFGATDAFVFATDRFSAQAWGNTVALRFGTPAVFVGLYGGGLGGEVIWWAPEIKACYRCLCSNRYQAHSQTAHSRSLDPSSDGATIFDIACLDAIAGPIIIGLLTRGANNRFGKLIAELDDRNFIQMSTDPSFQVAGRDVIREQLGIPQDRDTYFAWNTIARRDPDHGDLYCPDCEEYRGRVFTRSDQSSAEDGTACCSNATAPLGIDNDKVAI